MKAHNDKLHKAKEKKLAQKEARAELLKAMVKKHQDAKK